MHHKDNEEPSKSQKPEEGRRQSNSRRDGFRNKLTNVEELTGCWSMGRTGKTAK